MNIATSGYSEQAIRNALHSPLRKMSFRYELLDRKNQFIRHLNNVLDASISYNAFASIKRTARITISDTDDINYLSDRIKPYARLWIPPATKKIAIQQAHFLQPFFTMEQTEQIEQVVQAGGWAEWPLGIFLLSTPTRVTNEAGVVTREIEAYDQLQILLDDKIDSRHTALAGTNYITEIGDILTDSGITSANLTQTDKALPGDRDWEPGTTKLQIINDLLGAINYRSLYFDENGAAIAQPYVSPQARASEYTYRDDNKSVIFPEMEQALDLFSVPNKWVMVCSEPDRVPLVSSITNDNANSPTSTVSRGRIITDYRDDIEAADQASLDAITARIAFEASQVYEAVNFESAVMPFHGDSECLTLEYSKLGIKDKYIETSWSFDLRAGARMQHNVRRVVNV